MRKSTCIFSFILVFLLSSFGCTNSSEFFIDERTSELQISDESDLPDKSGVLNERENGLTSNDSSELEKDLTTSVNESADNNHDGGGTTSETELIQKVSAISETNLDKDKNDNKRDYRRILFVGDSRTIDMFADSDDNIYGVVYDGITVYGGHGERLDFMCDSVSDYGWDNFDTLVTWMGANERGNFGDYGSFYDEVLDRGKYLVICTVGPTEDRYLTGGDIGKYEDHLMQEFNDDLISYANDQDLEIIDLYTYIKNNILIDSDGIHYLPRPTDALWSYIVKNLL